MISPFYLFATLFIFLIGLYTPNSTVRKIPNELGIVAAFNQLPSEPLSIPLLRQIPFNEESGHIQGIQLFVGQEGYSAFLAGSSKDVAYIAQVCLDEEAVVKEIDTLMLSPYRHAGGFQIYDRFLAVGIEDNQLRNTAKVLIYDLEMANRWENPRYTLERNGPFERSTAGAVGITRYTEDIILVVADWNARNLDFYSCKASLFDNKKGHFSQIGSLEIASLDKSTWSDSIWHSYQNINLLADESGLYALAFGRDAKDNHVTDLFSITMSTFSKAKFISPVKTSSMGNLNTKVSVHEYFPQEISLEKISSRNFQCEDGADFRAGAGIYYSKGEIVLSAAPQHMDGKNAINFFVYPAAMQRFLPLASRPIRK